MSEVVKHIAETHADRIGTTICGRRLGPTEFYFVDIDHAFNNARNRGRLLTCKRCIAEVAKQFREERETPSA